MSSSDALRPTNGTSLNRRAMLRLFGCGLASAALAGCGGSGFRPLYGSLGGGEAVEKKMAQIDIVPIPGATGQRIRNELLFKARGGGDPLPPVYRLEVAIKESTTTTLVLRDGTSAANIYQIDAKFQLVRIKERQIMLQGQSSSRATFERFSNVYSNVRAADDAQDRAAKTIAVDLKSRIAAFLATAA